MRKEHCIRLAALFAVLLLFPLPAMSLPSNSMGAVASPQNARHKRAISKKGNKRQALRRKGKKRILRSRAEVGILVLDEAGNTVLEQEGDQPFNPASAVKVITAYGIICRLGIERKFSTRVFIDGNLSQSGQLAGNLYIESDDPDFSYSDVAMLKDNLERLGLRKVNGDLVVSPAFSFGWSDNAFVSAGNLIRALKGRKDAPGISIKGRVRIGLPPQSANMLFEQNSEPLRETLKFMLSYSVNGLAERLGRILGGPAALAEIVKQRLGIDAREIRLSSTSGLGRSRVTPRAMMDVIVALRAELKASGYNLQDILPVAGIDQGTLAKRFTSPGERGSVVGKTGTLGRTDSGVSSLVGVLGSRQGVLYFVIFCWHGRVAAFRRQQDTLVREWQNERGGAEPFAYQPPTALS